jgi:hypothetical protein
LAREAAAGKYEVIGEMTRADGGGIVYFGRDASTGQIVGLRLEAGPEATLMMTATSFSELDPTVELPDARRPSTDQLAKRDAGEITGRRLSVPRKASASTGSSSEGRSRPDSSVQRWSPTRLGLVTAAILGVILVVLFVYRLL